MDELINLASDEEITLFDKALQDYQNQSMDADRFTAARLQMGIYGQRQEGVNMVRIKLPGGRLNSKQLTVIADILEKYVQHDVVHITTRQDIQIHYVPLGDTPDVLRHLATAGLTTREACGNTIRNVTACSLSGVCPRQHVDVNRHLDGAVQHFLRNPLTQQMPRKFKISFSACESDCAQGMMHDMGIIAVQNGTKFGFKVLAGGGLGHKPHEAIVVEEFIEEKDLLLVMEAIISLHNRYSDRVKRAKARIKFLVDKFGREGFIEKYHEELERTKTALATQEYPKGEWNAGIDGEIPGIGAPRQLFEQKKSGFYVFPISIPMGNLNAMHLRGPKTPKPLEVKSIIFYYSFPTLSKFELHCVIVTELFEIFLDHCLEWWRPAVENKSVRTWLWQLISEHINSHKSNSLFPVFFLLWLDINGQVELKPFWVNLLHGH